MKIDFSNSINMYRKSICGNTNNKNSISSNTVKTDVMDFSHGKTSGVDKNMVALKSQIQGDVTYSADAKRIQELHLMVKNKTYQVSTDDIVKAIMDD